jgi:lipopolysaccharide export system permease protein
MTLSRYFARRYLVAFLGVMAVMAGILLLLDTVEQLRRFGGAGAGFAVALQLAALRMPSSLYAVLPLVGLLATLALFVALARSSELVVARAVGRSALAVVAAPTLVAAVLGVAAIAVLNPVVAATAKQYDQLAARLGGDEASLLSVSRDGLWLREATAAGQRVIRAARGSADGSRLMEVSILTFTPETGPVKQIEAASAELVPGAWVLHEARLWDLTLPNPEVAVSFHATLPLTTDLTPAALRDSFGPPGTIPLWDLPGFIASLERAGFAALEHRVWLQMELALPLMLAAMVLIGASFTLHHIRAGRQGLRVLMALLAGFGAFFLRDFAKVLGENGQIPVLLAAWSPPAVAALLALGLMLQLEEG